MEKILITGSLGQIGTPLVVKLREIYGVDNVIATDIHQNDDSVVCQEGIFEILDVLDVENFERIIREYKVDTLIHLAALLSAVAEAKPKLAWDLSLIHI